MLKTPVTYQTTEDAVEIIADATRLTATRDGDAMRRGCDTLIAMQDDVSPEIFERGQSIVFDDARTVEFLVAEVTRRVHERVLALVDSVSPGNASTRRTP